MTKKTPPLVVYAPSPAGDLFWLAEDPEPPLEGWFEPVSQRWDGPTDVYRIQRAVLLPDIWIAERVLTVDDHGDADETIAAYAKTEAAARKIYPTSLAAARRRQGIAEPAPTDEPGDAT